MMWYGKIRLYEEKKREQNKTEQYRNGKRRRPFLEYKTEQSRMGKNRICTKRAKCDDQPAGDSVVSITVLALPPRESCYNQR